ncbi:MAG: type II toxin-antitoxin system PemK/MazF family toxin, partial [Desulfovibrio sp.]|nr:type II toxin-antitoxin system PemK/MazF family toxin [Desulfovibrio sp.]
MQYPKQGEYIAIEFSPTEGHEQQGYRPALVLSVESVNRRGFV